MGRDTKGHTEISSQTGGKFWDIESTGGVADLSGILEEVSIEIAKAVSLFKRAHRKGKQQKSRVRDAYKQAIHHVLPPLDNPIKAHVQLLIPQSLTMKVGMRLMISPVIIVKIRNMLFVRNARFTFVLVESNLRLRVNQPLPVASAIGKAKLNSLIA